MFQLPPKTLASLSPDVFRIAIFDVTPCNKAWEWDFGLVYNYYNFDVMRAFLSDTLRAAESLERKGGCKVVVELEQTVTHADTRSILCTFRRGACRSASPTQLN